MHSKGPTAASALPRQPQVDSGGGRGARTARHSAGQQSGHTGAVRAGWGGAAGGARRHPPLPCVQQPRSLQAALHSRAHGQQGGAGGAGALHGTSATPGPGWAPWQISTGTLPSDQPQVLHIAMPGSASMGTKQTPGFDAKELAHVLPDVISLRCPATACCTTGERDVATLFTGKNLLPRRTAPASICCSRAQPSCFALSAMRCFRPRESACPTLASCSMRRGLHQFRALLAWNMCIIVKPRWFMSKNLKGAIQPLRKRACIFMNAVIGLQAGQLNLKALLGPPLWRWRWNHRAAVLSPVVAQQLHVRIQGWPSEQALSHHTLVMQLKYAKQAAGPYQVRDHNHGGWQNPTARLISIKACTPLI